MEIFDVEQRWPDLFAGLDKEQRLVVVQVLAAGWHEGFQPTRREVKNVADLAAGRIGIDEYLARSLDPEGAWHGAQ